MTSTRLTPAAQRALPQPWTRSWRVWSAFSCLAVAIAAGFPAKIWAADHAAPAKNTPPAPTPKEMGDQVRAAIENSVQPNKRLTLVVGGKQKKHISTPAKERPAPANADAAENDQAAEHDVAVVNPKASRQYIRSKAASLSGQEMIIEGPAPAPAVNPHGGEVRWSYDGENGPKAWGQLKADFNVCASGKRQSPIHIEDADTLQGPAEPLQFNYRTSNGTVVNDGHTILVDLEGDNVLNVRGSSFKLVELHFHTPSEERVNNRSFAMVAHLVHKNPEGQLAVVAVLLEPGAANALVDKVWTYMPLDAGDRVRMPLGLIDINELLPKDQRYYQFLGSLTTPPCTEGVLWMVLKQPTPISREQIRLFTQLFPNNARPVQAMHGRVVRNAQ